MSDLSNKVAAIAVGYLGPAAHIFLERQTKMHLEGLAFTDLEKKHLHSLQYWVRISAGLMLDKEKAQEFADRIGSL
jgi:hypothetical protein